MTQMVAFFSNHAGSNATGVLKILVVHASVKGIEADGLELK